MLQAVATGQAQTSGTAVLPKPVESVPFVVRVRLDNQDFVRRMPAGAAGTATIYTAPETHPLVRRVLLR